MSCTGPTLVEVGRTLQVLGVEDLRVSYAGGSWLATAGTDDGHLCSGEEPTMADAVNRAVMGVVRLRQEQRAEARVK